MILFYQVDFPDILSRMFLAVVIIVLLVAIVAVVILPRKRKR